MIDFCFRAIDLVIVPVLLVVLVVKLIRARREMSRVWRDKSGDEQ